MRYLIALWMTLFISNVFLAQTVHVTYKHIRSPAVGVYENLYINNKSQVLSVQDSLYTKDKRSNNLVFSSNSFKSPAFYFISDLNNKNQESRDFLFTDLHKDQMYFIYDKDVPKPNWEINKNKQKNILGKTCYFATCVFRGSKIQAYYTEDIPISAGPYKFFGLPGLILEVKETENEYNVWTAVKIDSEIPPQLNFKPQFSAYNKIEIKDFIKIKDANAVLEDKKMKEAAPMGTKVIDIAPNSKKRFGIEKIYDWE